MSDKDKYVLCTVALLSFYAIGLLMPDLIRLYLPTKKPLDQWEKDMFREEREQYQKEFVEMLKNAIPAILVIVGTLFLSCLVVGV